MIGIPPPGAPSRKREASNPDRPVPRFPSDDRRPSRVSRSLPVEHGRDGGVGLRKRERWKRLADVAPRRVAQRFLRLLGRIRRAGDRHNKRHHRVLLRRALSLPPDSHLEASHDCRTAAAQGRAAGRCLGRRRHRPRNVVRAEHGPPLRRVPLARNLVALLVLWTIPTTLVALSLRLDDIIAVAHGLLGLALVFVGLEAVAIMAADGDVFRFTPISTLDPISAGLVPALGCVAALCLRPRTTGGRLVQLVATTVLVAGTVIPGSRGPVLAVLACSSRDDTRPAFARFKVTLTVSVALGLAARRRSERSRWLSGVLDIRIERRRRPTSVAIDATAVCVGAAKAMGADLRSRRFYLLTG